MLTLPWSDMAKNRSGGFGLVRPFLGAILGHATRPRLLAWCLMPIQTDDHFLTACRYVLETLAEVYKNDLSAVPAQADAVARQRNLSPAERLRFHQAESGPLMKKLKEWFNQQFEDRLVEPNSGLVAGLVDQPKQAAAIAMRQALPEFIASAAQTSIFVKFLRDRLDLSRSEGMNLAA